MKKQVMTRVKISSKKKRTWLLTFTHVQFQLGALYDALLGGGGFLGDDNNAVASQGNKYSETEYEKSQGEWELTFSQLRLRKMRERRRTLCSRLGCACLAWGSASHPPLQLKNRAKSEPKSRGNGLRVE